MTSANNTWKHIKKVSPKKVSSLVSAGETSAKPKLTSDCIPVQ